MLVSFQFVARHAVTCIANGSPGCVQAASEDPSGCFVIVSSDSAAIPVLSTLRTLGRTALAVTASHEADDPETPAATAVPHSTAWLHLSLTGGGPLPTPAPPPPPARVPHPTAVSAPTSAPAVQPGPYDASPMAALSPAPETSGADAAANVNGHTPASPAPARQAGVESTWETPELPPEHQRALDEFVRLGIASKWALLGSRLKLMSGDIFSQLKGRMLADRAGYCRFAGFPKSLIKSKTFKHSLVAGLSAESTWSQMTQLAVMLMLRKFDSRDLNAQLGLLAIVRPCLKFLPLKIQLLFTVWVGWHHAWLCSPSQKLAPESLNCSVKWRPPVPQQAAFPLHAHAGLLVPVGMRNSCIVNPRNWPRKIQSVRFGRAQVLHTGVQRQCMGPWANRYCKFGCSCQASHDRPDAVSLL